MFIGDFAATFFHHARSVLITQEKPSFNIAGTTERRERQSAFSDLIFFDRGTDRNDPHVLVVPPMSGHYPTILRGTVEGLLQHHDVSVIDWAKPADIPLAHGPFNLKRNVDEIIEAIKNCGPNGHILAVSQSTIPTLIALCELSAARDEHLPQSVTFIGGPFSPSAAPTDLMRAVKEIGPDWFAQNVLTRTISGRSIYPGLMQHATFALPKAPEKFLDMQWDFLGASLGLGAPKHPDPVFQDEHNTVADIPGELFMDMMKHFCHEDLLNGKIIDLSKVKNIRVFTVEGGADDIAAPGQTRAIHRHLPNVQAHFNHVADGVGHYGIFHGAAWQQKVLPKITAFIRGGAEECYSPVPSSHLVLPASYFPNVQKVISITASHTGTRNPGSANAPEAALAA